MISGVPAVYAESQGGLLDVALSPGFAKDGLVYLAFAEPNLRGNLCGVVDLAAFLHGGEAASRPALAQAQCRLIGFNALLESNCAVLVDELLGMRTTQAFAQSSARQPSDPEYVGHTYVDHEGGRWRELNLQALSQQHVFLEIGA